MTVLVNWRSALPGKPERTTALDCDLRSGVEGIRDGAPAFISLLTAKLQFHMKGP
jgi:hypothetical protein